VVSGCSQDLQNTRTYRVGVINLNHDLEKVFGGFKKRLAEKGYIEGKNVAFIYNGSRTDIVDLENDLQAMISQKVDLILSITTPATKKAKQLTAGTGIPVVFAPVFDPVASGIVESLLKPGGNITGIKVGGSSGKALEFFLKVAPGTKNILVPYSKNNTATAQSLHELQIAAAKLKIQLSVREVSNSNELQQLLEKMPAENDAIWLLNSHFLVSHTPYFIEAAIRQKLPLGSSTSQVDGGVLLTYGQDASRTGEMAADLASKIFRGAPPASLPVEQTDFFLGLNLKTAKAIGIDISDDILHVADTIIRP